APTPALPRKREREQTAIAATSNVPQLAQHRQLDHIITMGNAAFQHRILQLEFEPGRGADAAYGGKGAAEHRAAVGKFLAAKAAMNQHFDREHGIERALL